MKKLLLILTVMGITGFQLAIVSYAQGIDYEMVSYTEGTYGVNTPFFNVGIFNQPKFTIDFVSFKNAFQFLFNLIIGVSIATSVILFMVAAFQEITESNNIKSVQRGKEGMQNAIVGLMIILSTWLIVNTINPDLLRLPIFQNIDQLGKQQQAQQPGNVTGNSF